MTEETETTDTQDGATQDGATHDDAKRAAGKVSPVAQLPLPGLAAIALYLLVLAGVIILGVVAGRHYPPVFLIFSALFIASSAGLLMLLRWAWSLALAAVVLLAGYNLWIFATDHQAAGLVQGLLNFVFFLYLVRPEVRERLR
jgi:hypothetical protein